MSDYICECGEAHTSYSGMMHCECADYDRYGRRKHARGDDWLD